MRLWHLEDITPHYARTLSCWRDNVHAHRREIMRMGYSAEFMRLWDFYLCYCEASFAERYNGDVQIVFVKPESRVETVVHPWPPVKGARVKSHGERSEIS